MLRGHIERLTKIASINSLRDIGHSPGQMLLWAMYADNGTYSNRLATLAQAGGGSARPLSVSAAAARSKSGSAAVMLTRFAQNQKLEMPFKLAGRVLIESLEALLVAVGELGRQFCDLPAEEVSGRDDHRTIRLAVFFEKQVELFSALLLDNSKLTDTVNASNAHMEDALAHVDGCIGVMGNQKAAGKKRNKMVKLRTVLDKYCSDPFNRLLWRDRCKEVRGWLVQGKLFKKHRHGKFHKRFVGCDDKFENVLWGKVGGSSAGGGMGKLGKFRIRDIIGVRKGTTTTNFAHYKDDAKVAELRDRCLSIVCQGKTLDLEAESMMDRDRWAGVFRDMIIMHNNKIQKAEGGGFALDLHHSQIELQKTASRRRKSRARKMTPHPPGVSDAFRTLSGTAVPGPPGLPQFNAAGDGSADYSDVAEQAAEAEAEAEDDEWLEATDPTTQITYYYKYSHEQEAYYYFDPDTQGVTWEYPAGTLGDDDDGSASSAFSAGSRSSSLARVTSATLAPISEMGPIHDPETHDAHLCEDTGHTYLVNKRSGSTSWAEIGPVDSAALAAAAAAAAAEEEAAAHAAAAEAERQRIIAAVGVERQRVAAAEEEAVARAAAEAAAAAEEAAEAERYRVAAEEAADAEAEAEAAAETERQRVAAEEAAAERERRRVEAEEAAEAEREAYEAAVAANEAALAEAAAEDAAAYEEALEAQAEAAAELERQRLALEEAAEERERQRVAAEEAAEAEQAAYEKAMMYEAAAARLREKQKVELREAAAAAQAERQRVMAEKEAERQRVAAEEYAAEVERQRVAAEYEATVAAAAAAAEAAAEAEAQDMAEREASEARRAAIRSTRMTFAPKTFAAVEVGGVGDGEASKSTIYSGLNTPMGMRHAMEQSQAESTVRGWGERGEQGEWGGWGPRGDRGGRGGRRGGG